MNEFIKIGDIANFLTSMKNTTTSSAVSPAGKKSSNGLCIVAGIVITGIVVYELYLYYKSKKELEQNSTQL
jgi:hypothetical protein